MNWNWNRIIIWILLQLLIILTWSSAYNYTWKGDVDNYLLGKFHSSEKVLAENDVYQQVLYIESKQRINILFVSFVDDRSLHHYAKYSFLINEIFALSQGHSLLLLTNSNQEDLETDLRWEKVRVIMFLLEEYNSKDTFDYFIWFDADLLFLDLFSDRDYFYQLIKQYANSSLLLSSEYHSETGIANTGCFIVKNNLISYDIFRLWYYSTDHSLGHDQILFDKLYRQLQTNCSLLATNEVNFNFPSCILISSIKILPANSLNSFPPVYLTLLDQEIDQYHVLHLMGESYEFRLKLFQKISLEFIWNKFDDIIPCLDAISQNKQTKIRNTSSRELPSQCENLNNWKIKFISKKFLQSTFYQYAIEKVDADWNNLLKIVMKVMKSLDGSSCSLVGHNIQEINEINELVSDLREHMLLLGKFPIEDIPYLLSDGHKSFSMDFNQKSSEWKSNFTGFYFRIFSSLSGFQNYLQQFTTNKCHAVGNPLNKSIFINLLNLNLVFGNDLLSSFFGNEGMTFHFSDDDIFSDLIHDLELKGSRSKEIYFSFDFKEKIFTLMETRLFPHFHELTENQANLREYVLKSEGIFFQNQGKFFFTRFQQKWDENRMQSISYLQLSLSAFTNALNIYEKNFYPNLAFRLNDVDDLTESVDFGKINHHLEVYELCHTYFALGKSIYHSFILFVSQNSWEEVNWSVIYSGSLLSVNKDWIDQHPSSLISFSFYVIDHSLNNLQHLLFPDGSLQVQENHFQFITYLSERLKSFFEITKLINNLPSINPRNLIQIDDLKRWQFHDGKKIGSQNDKYWNFLTSRYELCTMTDQRAQQIDDKFCSTLLLIIHELSPFFQQDHPKNNNYDPRSFDNAIAEGAKLISTKKFRKKKKRTPKDPTEL